MTARHEEERVVGTWWQRRGVVVGPWQRMSVTVDACVAIDEENDIGGSMRGREGRRPLAAEERRRHCPLATKELSLSPSALGERG